MPTGTKDEPTFREYVAWDAPTRWFHWINAVAILGLIATGLVILTGGQLGLSPEGKISLKSVHVILGYVMAVNLLWRFIWAFFGNLSFPKIPSAGDLASDFPCSAGNNSLLARQNSLF